MLILYSPFISFLEKRNEAKKFKRWNKNPVSSHSHWLHRKLASGIELHEEEPSAQTCGCSQQFELPYDFTDFYYAPFLTTVTPIVKSVTSYKQ